MNNKILILDFGSQVTQLIARNIRELNVYCEIQPCTKPIAYDPMLKGVILSGSPCSVNEPDAPTVEIAAIANHVPVLAICYGAQLLAKQAGGEVGKSAHREYGRAHLRDLEHDPLFATIPTDSQVWMSHSDSIKRLPDGFKLIARTDSIPVAAYRSSESYAKHSVHAIQFHPEVTHSTDGRQMLKNFITDICKAEQDWTPAHFIQETVDSIKARVGDKKVVMALSGGVDSTVAATLIHRAIGGNLYCIFVDNGLLRKDEFQQVLDGYKHLGLNVKGVDARQRFYSELDGVSDPEKKRKIIGKGFIEVFNDEAIALTDVSFLGQGTIYPDVIESMSVHGGPTSVIKSHHNVGGLPEKMHLQLVEPLRSLFKDEVRKVGRELGIDDIFIGRHPFPGPGLGIRILGAVSEEKVKMLQEADHIYIQHLRDSGMYNKVWQAGAILLPVQSVGVMGDERTYEYTCALRAVTSVDGMTADWAHLPYDLLAKISNDIINRVRGINRVVYDISSKPPATIEWE